MSESELFSLFRMARIREARDYDELTHERVSLKEIKKAYDRWAISGGKKRLTVNQLKDQCDKIFGLIRGSDLSYCHIRVFNDEEDVEDFELRHSFERVKELEEENNQLRKELKNAKEEYANTSLLLKKLWKRNDIYSDSIETLMKQLMDLYKSLYALEPEPIEPVSSDAP